MKKEMIILFLIGIFLTSPLILAQEETQTYSGFSRLIDNVKLAFSGGDNEVRLALEIREKEVNSAIVNTNNGNNDEAEKNLERARERLHIVQEKVSLETSEEIQTNVNEIVNKIEDEENLSDEFENYLLEEEKTQLTAVLTEKTFEYCTELAKEDFTLMLKEEECNPDTAIPGLEKELENLKDLQERMFVQLMLEIRSCMDDPGTCNCENNFDDEQKAKCEKMVSLALKCEYQDDEGACNELNSLEAPKAESFVPEFLMNLFRAKEEQMLWGEKPSDCVPEECWNYNDKPECRQYDKFKETKEDWDEYGNFIGTRNKCGKEGSTPTMQESIPQCFDGDVFLEEKCGKITMVENEEGLINYIIENEINGILGKFTNDSVQNTIDVNESDGQMQVQNKTWEIKEEMSQIKNQIKNITYAIGTGPGGDSGVVIQGDKQGVVTGGGDSGNNVVDGDKQGVVTSDGNNVVDNTVVSSGDLSGDTGSNDVAGVDEGPGEPGVVD
ncbi:MAG: hypothetical protein KKF68_02790 [Nanoarchaeota archaeon]|nr:hypothetical protein [Nanoarchaeota archaeon]